MASNVVSQYLLLMRARRLQRIDPERFKEARNAAALEMLATMPEQTAAQLLGMR
jgi:hypothetical protein